MHWMTIGFGVLLIAYSLYVLALRIKGKNQKLWKLEPMKKFWGSQLGSLIHGVGYIAVPFVSGCVLIIRGAQGNSLF